MILFFMKASDLQNQKDKKKNPKDMHRVAKHRMVGSKNVGINQFYSSSSWVLLIGMLSFLFREKKIAFPPLSHRFLLLCRTRMSGVNLVNKFWETKKEYY